MGWGPQRRWGSEAPAERRGREPPDNSARDGGALPAQELPGAVPAEPDHAVAGVEVAVGDAVRVTVTSDVDAEVHVHGVDQTADLPTGRPTTLELSFAEPGVYEVETHESGLLLLQLIVR